MVGALFLVAFAVGGSAASHADLTFEVTLASRDGRVTGTLSAIDADGAVRVGDTSIVAGDLVELRRFGATRPLPPINRAHVVLVNGDRWGGRVHRVENDRLKFAPSFVIGSESFGTAKEVELPLTAVSAMWLTDEAHSVRSNGMLAEAQVARRSDDHLWLTNGDVLRGTLVGVEPAAVKFQVTGTLQSLPIARVKAILLSTDAARAARPKGTVAKAVFADGSRVTLSEARLQDGRLIAKTPAGVGLRVLPERLVSLITVPGPATYLSDLKPVRFEHTPYLGLKWPLAVDRSANGAPLQIGNEAFDRGLGMHSRSEAVFAVPRGTSRFEAWVGLNAAAKAGQVAVSVKIDGKDLFGPADLTGRDKERRLSLPLPKSAGELSLLVDFGAGGDVQDRVDWGDARFVVPR